MIFHLIPSLSVCGDAAQLLMLAKACRGEEVHIFTFSPVPGFVRDGLKAFPHIQVHEFRTHFSWEPYVWCLWTAHRQKLRPRLVQVWGNVFLAAGWRLAAHFQAKSVAVLRHFDPWQLPQTALLRSFDALVTNNSGVQRCYEKFKVAANWHVIPDALPDSFPSQNFLTRDAFLQEFALPSDAILAACVGPVNEWKRWNWAVWTVDSIVRVHPEMNLIFFEPESERPEKKRRLAERRLVERFVRQYEREPIVHWEGWRSDFSRVLPFCDFLWCPQSVPGSGTALLEAAAAGVAVVTTETDGIHEFLPENSASFVQVYHETTALASASHLLCIHPEEKEAQSRAAQNYVRENFIFESIFDRWQQFYTALCGRPLES